jgi:hypothetical protein
VTPRGSAKRKPETSLASKAVPGATGHTVNCRVTQALPGKLKKSKKLWVANFPNHPTRQSLLPLAHELSSPTVRIAELSHRRNIDSLFFSLFLCSAYRMRAIVLHCQTPKRPRLAAVQPGPGGVVTQGGAYLLVGKQRPWKRCIHQKRIGLPARRGRVQVICDARGGGFASQGSYRASRLVAGASRPQRARGREGAAAPTVHDTARSGEASRLVPLSD